MEVGSGFKGLLSEMGGNKMKDGECSTEEVKSELVLKDNKNLPKSEEDCGGLELMRVMSSGDRGGELERIGVRNGAATNALVSMDDVSHESVKENDIVSESSANEEHESIRKRKRENNSNMLKWIISVARDPCDLAVGSLTERSKWKSYSSEHLWKQALLVRESRFVKPAHSRWKSKPMYPRMFEDSDLGGSQRMAISQRTASVEFRKKLQRIFNVKMSGAGAGSSEPFWLDKNYEEGLVLVGSEFQADVPEWNRKAVESDSKWLGSRIWPIVTRGRNLQLIERGRIGSGRQDTCGCQLPGSQECVGFHINTEKERMKLELGPAYYGWKFDQMGEEVARFWTREEEEIFHDSVRSNPLCIGMLPLNQLPNMVCAKDFASVVRYYFNVFILRRRAYPNRICPNDIDSDDERRMG